MNHVNIGVYLKRILIPIIGKLLKLMDIPQGFISKLSALLDFFVVDH